MTDHAPSSDQVLALARANNLILPDPYAGELVEAYSHVSAMLVRFRSCQTPPGDLDHVFVPVPAEQESPS